ncbi:unnamed protein product [Pleuronectes platessa]|uniref:Uncharacterized protein n=1 Tax=Pleuronectes platessa TaxID=8262 RepID=A0A9N7VNU2_PLEPL|nr:unnamed protein product [Pleuronectes platessa]
MAKEVKTKEGVSTLGLPCVGGHGVVPGTRWWWLGRRAAGHRGSGHSKNTADPVALARQQPWHMWLVGVAPKTTPNSVLTVNWHSWKYISSSLQQQPLSLFHLTSHELSRRAGIHCGSAEMAIIGMVLWVLHPALWSHDDLCRMGGLID